ncbi:MAG: hypothetical protein ACK54K_10605, partial [Gemmatimonadaceae bacterium]
NQINTIIVILPAITFKKKRIDNARVETAARAIDLANMAAQRDAVSRQHNVLVVFDTAARALRTVWDVNNDRTAGAGERLRTTPLSEALAFARPPGVSALGGDSTSASAGVPDERGPALLLQRSGSTDRAVTVYLTTTQSLRPKAAVRDVRALQVARASGRSSWFIWNGSVWRRAQ